MSQKKANISTNDVTITPNGKKLIQARLPFKTLATTPKSMDTGGTVESRKRKLSNAEDDNRSIKLLKTSGTTKENIEKAGDVTVQEMVDLVDDSSNDVVMKDNEKVRTIYLTKQTKKSTKSKDVELKDELPRRSSCKHDSEMSTKVVIKIPSSKKKKVNVRPEKVNVVLKIDENEDDDDDIIPIDSEENSLISVDEKEKNVNDLSIILLDEESSFVSDDKSSDSKKKRLKVKKNVDEMTNDAEGKKVPITKTFESAGSVIEITDEKKTSEARKKSAKADQLDVNSIHSKGSVSPISEKAANTQETELVATTKENEASGEDHDTNKIDQSDIVTIDSEENILPSSDKLHNIEQDATNEVCAEKVENLLTSISEKSALEKVVENQVEATMDLILTSAKFHLLLLPLLVDRNVNQSIIAYLRQLPKHRS